MQGKIDELATQLQQEQNANKMKFGDIEAQKRQL